MKESRCNESSLLMFFPHALPLPQQASGLVILSAVKMELKVTPSILILLVSLMFADARYSMVPLMHMLEGESTCNSCLEASRKAERTLKQTNLLKEFDMLSSEVCHALPSNFEAQCMEKSKIQINHTKSSLEEFFDGKSLCGGTGLCVDERKPQDEIKIIVESNGPIDDPIESEDERACIACRRAVKDLLMKMRQPKMKTKIIGALIEYCEEAEDNEDQCKRTVWRYASTVLNKLERLKPTDICVMMGMCDEGLVFENTLD